MASGIAPIFLYTDFGSGDLYVGQVKAMIHTHAPGVTVIDLLHDAPSFDIAAGAHLLAALAARLPQRAVVMAVVDPGVGSTRDAIALECGGRWFVGPDNGLLAVVAARAGVSRVLRILPRTEELSVSFHGRDLFAPAVARLAREDTSALEAKARLDIEADGRDVAQVIYVDHYGNVMTGLRTGAVDEQATIGVCGRTVSHARVFSAVPQRTLFWYVNSIGLIEIAANQASAAQLTAAKIGDPVTLP